ncbi:MAG: histidine phosphatase family protein [Litoreibacter sp.]
MSYPDLYIARHGETEWNALGRMQGRLHSALTRKGEAQARDLGRILAANVPEGVRYVSSPQTRAVHTAALALSHTAAMIETDVRLCEIDVGAWQGRIRDELTIHGDPKQTPDGPLAFYEQAVGGEGFRALRLRCEDFLADLTGPSVLITHGITGRMLRAVALNVGDDALVDLPGGQGVVFHISGSNQKILS